eukprot:g14885.t1
MDVARSSSEVAPANRPASAGHHQNHSHKSSYRSTHGHESLQGTTGVSCTPSTRRKHTEKGLKMVISSVTESVNAVSTVSAGATDAAFETRSSSSKGSSLASSRRSSLDRSGGQTLHVGTAGGADASEASNRIEELLLQNAELKRNLQVLQQGVVESMRGNKARFMGSGGGSSSSKAASVSSHGQVKLPNLHDLDELKQILQRKNQQIHELEGRIVDAETDLARERRAGEELAQRHGRELLLWEERWQAKTAECDSLVERLSQLERVEKELQSETHRAEALAAEVSAEKERAVAEKEAAEEREAQLEHEIRSEKAGREDGEKEVERTREELEEARRKLREAEREKAEAKESEMVAERALREREEAVERLTTECRRLHSSLEAALAATEKKAAQMFSLSLRVFASSDAGNLRCCFNAWAQARLEGKCSWEEKQRRAMQEDAARRAADLEAQLVAARAEYETWRAEFAALKKKECDAALAACKSEAERLKSEAERLRSEAERLKRDNADLRKQLDELRKELKDRSLPRKNPLEARVQELLAKVQELESNALSSSSSASATTAVVQEQSGRSSSSGSEEEWVLSQKQREDFYRKREETLVRDNQALQDKVKELSAAMPAASLPGGVKPFDGERKWRLKVKSLEEAHAKAALRAKTEHEAAVAKLQADHEAHAEKQRDSVKGRISDLPAVPAVEAELAELAADRNELLKRVDDLERLSNARIAKWKEAIEQNLVEVRKSTRMLVTTPKIAITVAGGGLATGAGLGAGSGSGTSSGSAAVMINGNNFPLERIREAIEREVVPKFQKCMHVSEEEYGEDS